MLKNKNILFIAPEFFNYHIHIISELEKMGANVTYFGEKRCNIVYRFLKNTTQKGFSFYNRLYEKKIERKVNNLNFDYFFLIRGEHISNQFINGILSKNKNCRSIYYQWDSFKTNPNGLNIYTSFDKFLSFDKTDCDKIEKLEYLPLFYIEEYQKLRNTQNQIIYDVLFVGTLHNDRHERVNDFEKICINNGLRFKFYLYTPFLQYLKLVFIKKRLLKRISFKSLSENVVLKLVSQSKGILDLPNPNQQGMTIRSIESLAAGKKLITTSTAIINERFYSSDQVLLYKDSIKLSEFINKPSQIQLNKLLSLHQWLCVVFS